MRHPPFAWVVLLSFLAGCVAEGPLVPDVKFTLVGERPGKPPLVRPVVAMVATNPTARDQWVLVGRKKPVQQGGTNLLQQYAARGVFYGRCLGRDGIYAFLLGPGAKLTVRHLELEWWDLEVKPPIDVPVRVGHTVTFGGVDAADWFDRNPRVSGTVEIDADEAVHMRSHRSPGDVEVDVVVKP